MRVDPAAGAAFADSRARARIRAGPTGGIAAACRVGAHLRRRWQGLRQGLPHQRHRGVAEPSRCCRWSQKYVGADKTLADLEDAAKDVEVALQRQGLFLAQAYIPEQSLGDGIVVIQVLEGHIGAVTVEVEPGVRSRPNSWTASSRSCAATGCRARSDREGAVHPWRPARHLRHHRIDARRQDRPGRSGHQGLADGWLRGLGRSRQRRLDLHRPLPRQCRLRSLQPDRPRRRALVARPGDHGISAPSSCAPPGSPRSTRSARSSASPRATCTTSSARRSSKRSAHTARLKTTRCNCCTR